jgi:hypothetical protein
MNKFLEMATETEAKGFARATVYFVFISRRYAGKVSVKRDNQGFY